MAATRTLSAFLFVLISVGAYSAAWPPDEVPFVPTPVEVVDRMLEMAAVKKGDVVYDLGSGDGRILIRAAKKYGARGVGIELDSWLVAIARAKAKEEEVDTLVEFRAGDAAQADLSGATVITLYMLPWFNEMMRPKFQTQLKPGARIVSHDYGIEGWPPDKVEQFPIVEKRAEGFTHEHTLYLWRVK
ncbi:MAG TPA: class I SAM-dependent methyltransferase [Candidatus Binatia bacterium]